MPLDEMAHTLGTSCSRGAPLNAENSVWLDTAPGKQKLVLFCGRLGGSQKPETAECT